jgi:polysaccharide export outer membrane protein
MPTYRHGRLAFLVWAVLLCCWGGTGCLLHHHQPDPNAPHELARTIHPPYVIEAPDIILVDAVRLVPKPPYRIEPLDSLVIQVTDALTRKHPFPEEPVSGIYTVGPEGSVDLGFNWGVVDLAGLTLKQAREVILVRAQKRWKDKLDVVVEVAQTRALQQVRGEHLVRPDGTIGLGTYGSVIVDGLTIAQAKAAIEQHLGQFLVNPEVSVDVAGYNSKVYYVIADGGGLGQQVVRLPITGKETVLDAISLVNGLPPVASKSHIWVARPLGGPKDGECVMKVDWNAITRRGSTATNYQMLPGDRLYVMAVPLVTADTWIARIISPMERILGFALLGRTTVQAFENNNGSGNNTVR